MIPSFPVSLWRFFLLLIAADTYPQNGGSPFSFIVLGLAISGALLGAGFTEGTVYILDAMSLENESSEPFKYSKSSVSHVSFSHDSNYMATAVSSSLCSVLLPMDKGARGLGKVGLYPSQAGVQRGRERVGNAEELRRADKSRALEHSDLDSAALGGWPAAVLLGAHL